MRLIFFLQNFSKYCKQIGDEYEIKVGNVKKLIPNLGNKTNYVVHYRNLQLYFSLGMKLTNIHRVWMNATNDFEKDFLKLMISSVYGKTMKIFKKNQCEISK